MQLVMLAFTISFVSFTAQSKILLSSGAAVAMYRFRFQAMVSLER